LVVGFDYKRSPIANTIAETMIIIGKAAIVKVDAASSSLKS
jgi:hypothetical protein